MKPDIESWEDMLYRGVKKLRASKAANAEQHAHAFHTPRAGFESAMVSLVSGLAEYADAHRKAYDSGIAEDHVIGDAWRDIAKGVLELLNGECGRLDCGTLDSSIRDVGALAGFESDADWDVADGETDNVGVESMSDVVREGRR